MKSLRLTAALAFFSPFYASAQIPVSDVDLTRFYLRLGASFIYPQDDATALKYDLLQHWDLYNTRWKIDDDTTWNFSTAWRPLPYFGLEFLYIGGAEHHADLTRFSYYPGRDNIRFGDFKTTSANLFANWYMTDETCLGQPYLGVGVNYTDFYDDKLDRQFQDYLVDSGLAVRSSYFGMGHSWGVSAQLGLDWRLGQDRSWLINGAILYTDADTDAQVIFPTKPGYERLYFDYDYNPWTLNLGVTYEF